MGRPAKLTPEIGARIAKAVAAGNYPEVAAESEGVGKSTFYRWMEQGARDESGPYKEFREAITRARARAERKMVRIVRTAAITEPQSAQWYLERSAADRWGRRDKVVVENAVREELDRALSKLEAAMTAEEFDRVLRILADDGAGSGAAVATDDAGEAVH
jgi:transposase